jgi:N,N'-diacetyllegionaminate synthase
MVYIIAEGGVDHEGEMTRAIKLLYEAVEAKANCFKIQYYSQGFKGKHRTLPWLPPECINGLIRRAEEEGIDFLITPHDRWALDWIIDETNLHQIKIGSGDWDLLQPAIDSGKEIILSTGGHTWDEITHWESEVGGILYCVSEYPCPPEHLDFDTLREMVACIENDIGFSDHTSGTACALAAVGLGAEIIEKHMTLERNVEGRNDTTCSLLPEEWPQFVNDIRAIEAALAK